MAKLRESSSFSTALPPTSMASTAASPESSASYDFEWGPSPASSAASPARITADLSPPLIAMVAVVGTAFLIVLYARILSHHLRRLLRRWRRWRRRRRLLRSTSAAAAAASSDLDSPHPGVGGFGGGAISYGSSSDYYYFASPYGLDDTAIRALPISLFSKSKAKHLAATNRECAVCLLEFEDDDPLRTLPFCSHAFHADCIDVWLRSHATCPLCRASAVRPPDSPFVPMRAARIRPSLDDLVLYPPHPAAAIAEADPEIAAASPPSIRGAARDFLLKRSYSFGFERSLAAERMVLDASTASPWRYRHRSFWSKRWPSPFGSGGASAPRAARVFSFRSYRFAAAAGKSPFSRRRGGFFPLASEPSARLGGAGPSSRRSRSMTSPSAIFARPPGAAAAALGFGFSSSRMRCGDPEALLSPERLNRG
ncbi:RING-H2 finger protein ATL65 [Ananas comosus]|uniref:RING-type E3 ubiquitin transferase n=1 Tax=Ananas comosus TaxID=4615 RepID=A0A199VP76_ANACO|nr:RING-H2 finger protein ATL65 [Ananas comosus]